jgi:hypothetical protein
MSHWPNRFRTGVCPVPASLGLVSGEGRLRAPPAPHIIDTRISASRFQDVAGTGRIWSIGCAPESQMSCGAMI